MTGDKWQRIVELINCQGHSATYEYPGFIAVVSDDEDMLSFGFANGNLGYDRMKSDGEFVEADESENLNESSSEEELAAWICAKCD